MNKGTFLSRPAAIILLMLILLLTLKTSVYGVSEAAVLFLLISPSPEANALGQTSGCITSSSPMAVISNPASLGFFAQKNFIGTCFYPQKVSWLPGLADDIKYAAGNTSIGVNLQSFTNIPLSLGLALNKTRFDLGSQYITGEDSPEPIGSFRSWEQCKGTTFSIALDYYVRLSLGYTTKNIKSHLPSIGAGAETSNGDATADAHDIGFLFELPVYDIIRATEFIEGHSSNKVEPFLNLGYYYSKTNIGGKITYVDAAQADPLPRSLSLGINKKIGLAYKAKYFSFNIASFKWAREADDMLIWRYSDGTSKYLSGLNDIKLWDNIFAGKANSKIITKKGFEINLADFYFIRYGKYENIEGNIFMNTEGWGVNYLQPLKIIAGLLQLDDINALRYLSNISFEEHYSRYHTQIGNPLYKTKFKSYVIRLQNFPLENLF